MYQILFATDGSEHADAALDIAAALAVRDGSEVHAVHVVTDRQPTDVARHAVEVEFADELVERSRSAMLVTEPDDEKAYAKVIMSRQGDLAKVVNTIMGERILKRADAALHKRLIARVTTRLAEGEPAERILELARECDADYIVMGSHGHGRLEGMLMGSVSQAVAHRASCRVVMVT